MDWRGRKYYVVTFAPDSYDMRIDIFKNMEGVKISSPIKNFMSKLPDEQEARGDYHILIGCKEEISKDVESELKKAESRDGIGTTWKEIKRDISKKYFDIYGNEMPYRRCDMNPKKRCNHCMDC